MKRSVFHKSNPCSIEELTQSDPMLGEDGPPPEIVLLGGSGKTTDKSLEILAFSRKLHRACSLWGLLYLAAARYGWSQGSANHVSLVALQKSSPFARACYLWSHSGHTKCSRLFKGSILSLCDAKDNGKCTPCIHFTTRAGCKHAEACRFCHLEHGEDGQNHEAFDSWARRVLPDQVGTNRLRAWLAPGRFPHRQTERQSCGAGTLFGW